ncbi:MAG: phospho-N-acetylmuramoyl-pentapeptide-transferase [Lachnospiraceae bacterium]|nr:phospho-N-acetylmuramoyl-pentapeptide-transferase [Lachnospiraceae bacterium]
MNYVAILAGVIAFAVTAVLGPVTISFLRRLKAGQTVREEGPKTHLTKTGTPTMGGILIVFAILVGSLFFVMEYPKILPILFLTLGLGLVGFWDDYLKVVKKNSKGLRAWQKMGLQLLVTGIFLFYVEFYTDISLAMKVPFMPDVTLDLGILTIPFLFLVIIGTDTGANFTDGMDGLASSVTAMISVFFAVVAFGTNSGIEPLTCAVTGALLGFLLFNWHPAKVFMGDTGALAIGGFVAGTAIVLQLPLFLLIIAVVYVVEVASVIIQVTSFKLFGKRVFLMTPIHHHFELLKWKEPTVVAMFTVVTALACVLAFFAL